VQITLKVDPDEADIDAVRVGLRAYNRAQIGRVPFYQNIALHLRDADGAIVGGLTATAVLDWLFIEFLHVNETHRGHDHGRALMAEAEVYARANDLAGIWLDTFAFQARGFYEKLGFSVFGVIEDHPRGSARYFLQKRFERI
jgi:ribosomal protein S18 acetylase RimI-like enzyme